VTLNTAASSVEAFRALAAKMRSEAQKETPEEREARRLSEEKRKKISALLRELNRVTSSYARVRKEEDFLAGQGWDAPGPNSPCWRQLDGELNSLARREEEIHSELDALGVESFETR